MRATDELLEAIAREQALIARLEREREEARGRVRSLQAELVTPAGAAEQAASPSPTALPLTTATE